VSIAAFFDVDGTLIARNSAQLYVRHLRRTGQARRRDVARTIWFLLQYKLGLLDLDRALAATMEFVRGRDEASLADDCRLWYQAEIRPFLLPAMRHAVGLHRDAGHVPVLLTSITKYLAEPIAQDLGFEHLLVSELVVRDGLFTGEVTRPICYGTGKVHWAKQFCSTHGVDLDRSYFYTDSITDLPVLELVGRPRVVNPDPRLAREARRRGWLAMHLGVGGPAVMPVGLDV
jgi:HAD superfamily hydrolase (TIGR01490 family)